MMQNQVSKNFRRGPGGARETPTEITNMRSKSEKKYGLSKIGGSLRAHSHSAYEGKEQANCN